MRQRAGGTRTTRFVARPPALAERGDALVERDRLVALGRGQDRAEQLAQERLVVHERPPAEVAERRWGSLRRHAMESRPEAAEDTGPRAKIWAPGLDRARMRG